MASGSLELTEAGFMLLAQVLNLHFEQVLLGAGRTSLSASLLHLGELLVILGHKPGGSQLLYSPVPGKKLTF